MEHPEQGAPVAEDPERFAKRVGLPITNLLLLNRSLTHGSYLNEHPEALEDNERLEFLGDAVLDFLVGDWLYNHYPEMSEGQLTRMRSALVRTEQLAEFAREINLGAAMRLGSGEGRTGGRQRQALLCDTFEALIGAVYLDSGLDSVGEFMKPRLAAASIQIMMKQKDQDPKSLLQELVQSRGLPSPLYRTVSTSGPEHEKIFEIEVSIDGKVYGHGLGNSKRAAAKIAARQALREFSSE